MVELEVKQNKILVLHDAIVDLYIYAFSFLSKYVVTGLEYFSDTFIKKSELLK